jgi:hypothetical protein
MRSRDWRYRDDPLRFELVRRAHFNLTPPQPDMTTPLNHSHVYRSLLREFRRSVSQMAHLSYARLQSLADALVRLVLPRADRPLCLQSIVPRAQRSQALNGYLRSLVSTLPATSSEGWTTKSVELLEVGKFMTAQRTHKVSSHPLGHLPLPAQAQGAN